MPPLPLPRFFDGTSIIVMDNAISFNRFLANERVALKGTVVDYHPDIDFKYLQEGPCLVALEGSFAFEIRPHPRLWRDSVPASDPRDCVLKMLASLWPAEYLDGTIFAVKRINR